MATFQTLLASPSFHLTMFALVGATAAQGFVALWATTSRLHWFWRALAVWAAVIALGPIRAYQPALVFAISSPLVVVLVLVYRGLLGRFWPQGKVAAPESLRFGVRDVLLAMAVVGMWLAGLLYFYKHVSDDLFIDELATMAAAIGVLQAFTYCTAVGPRRWLAGIVLLFAIPGFAVALEDALLLWDAFLNVRLHKDEFAPIRCLILSLFGLEAVAVIAAACGMAGAALSEEADSFRRSARIALCALSLLVGIPLLLIYWRMLWLEPFPPFHGSPENHYVQIVSIARRVNRNTTPEVRAASHAEVLPLLRAGNHVPPGLGVSSSYSNYYYPLRELADSLDGESKAAVARGDLDTGAEMTVANVRIGVMLSRGGIPTDELVGDAIAGRGRNRLIAVRDKLSAAKSRQVISLLTQSLAELEPFDTIWARGRAYDEHQNGWEVRLEHVVYDFGFGDPVEQICRNVRRRMMATYELLRTDLAIRLFADENGRLPARLEELVPAHLTQVPTDPYSGGPLIYLPAGQSFGLYSVGSDRRDDNGKFTDWRTYHSTTGYDFDLDTMTRP